MFFFFSFQILRRADKNGKTKFYYFYLLIQYILDYLIKNKYVESPWNWPIKYNSSMVIIFIKVCLQILMRRGKWIQIWQQDEIYAFEVRSPVIYGLRFFFPVMLGGKNRAIIASIDWVYWAVRFVCCVLRSSKLESALNINLFGTSI